MSTFVTSPYVGCSAAEKPFWPKRDKSQGFGDSVPESGKPPFPYFVLRAGPASRTGFCSSHPLVRTTHTKQRRTRRLAVLGYGAGTVQQGTGKWVPGLAAKKVSGYRRVVPGVECGRKIPAGRG